MRGLDLLLELGRWTEEDDYWAIVGAIVGACHLEKRVYELSHFISLKFVADFVSVVAGNGCHRLFLALRQLFHGLLIAGLNYFYELILTAFTIED